MKTIFKNKLLWGRPDKQKREHRFRRVLSYGRCGTPQPHYSAFPRKRQARKIRMKKNPQTDRGKRRALIAYDRPNPCGLQRETTLPWRASQAKTVKLNPSKKAGPKAFSYHDCSNLYLSGFDRGDGNVAASARNKAYAFADLASPQQMGALLAKGVA